MSLVESVECLADGSVVSWIGEVPGVVSTELRTSTSIQVASLAPALMVRDCSAGA